MCSSDLWIGEQGRDVGVTQRREATVGVAAVAARRVHDERQHHHEGGGSDCGLDGDPAWKHLRSLPRTLWCLSEKLSPV